MRLIKTPNHESLHKEMGLSESQDIVITSTFDEGESIETLQEEGRIDSNGNPIIKYYYTANVPKLVIGEGKNKRTIDVVVSSSQDSDEILLHKLLSKMTR